VDEDEMKEKVVKEFQGGVLISSFRYFM